MTSPAGRDIDPQPVLAALADPTRLAVFERLSSQGPASASKLATELPVSRQAISKHLDLLGSVGLVDRSRAGREVVFSARREPLGEVAGWLERVGAEWDERLERLQRSFE
ncbi:MAG: metalloregulator ArsR/SmtB family transcription factor [Acidimicrobiia bacterium]|jgi:DNA-binding transcriptional ArsR family regulator